MQWHELHDEVNGGRGRQPRFLPRVLMILVCCGLLAACAGQRLEVKPRGQTVFSVGAGSR